MKILIDMNLSPDWVEMFTAANIESAHWSSIGDPAAKDTILMAYAQINDYVVFTNDLDFGTLLAIQQRNLPSSLSENYDFLSNRFAVGCVMLTLTHPWRLLGALRYR